MPYPSVVVAAPHTLSHSGTLQGLPPYRSAKMPGTMQPCNASIHTDAEARGERGGEVGDLVERHRGSAKVFHTLNTA